jgi:hypothetical protein
LNAANPVGTVQSIEHTLRSLDKLAAEQQSRVARREKELVDYQAQADRPFEHEDRLKQLIARQCELNSQLDLDKGDQQGADSVPEINEEEVEQDKTRSPAVLDSGRVAKMAEAYMRAGGTAIREMPIFQRSPPGAGSVTGRAVAKDDSQVAVATAANRFIVVEAAALGRDVQIGETLSLLFSQGRPSIDNDRQTRPTPINSSLAGYAFRSTHLPSGPEVTFRARYTPNYAVRESALFPSNYPDFLPQ